MWSLREDYLLCASAVPSRRLLRGSSGPLHPPLTTTSRFPFFPSTSSYNNNTNNTSNHNHHLYNHHNHHVAWDLSTPSAILPFFAITTHYPSLLDRIVAPLRVAPAHSPSAPSALRRRQQHPLNNTTATITTPLHHATPICPHLRLHHGHHHLHPAQDSHPLSIRPLRLPSALTDSLLLDTPSHLQPLFHLSRTPIHARSSRATPLSTDHPLRARALLALQAAPALSRAQRRRPEEDHEARAAEGGKQAATRRVRRSESRERRRRRLP